MGLGNSNPSSSISIIAWTVRLTEGPKETDYPDVNFLTDRGRTMIAKSAV